MKDYIHIGRFVATHGLEGELVLKHALGKKTGLKDVEAIFVEEQKNSYLPYFLQASKSKTVDEILVKLEGVDTKESARRIANRPVWLLNDDFRRLAAKTSPISLLGFEIINEGQALGKVEEIIEQPHQVLLRTTLNGNEALLPLHEQTLEKIDRKKQQVYLVLPDGLLDIYR
ncbi:MAG TPA: ribosome maturation factor RimM [Chitinophagaceae bacterium]|jgi:16S rRNA processing protein RimM|nr:ribosome maturation factor RimM [Chitinophagaceae bacterium]